MSRNNQSKNKTILINEHRPGDHHPTRDTQGLFIQILFLAFLSGFLGYLYVMSTDNKVEIAKITIQNIQMQKDIDELHRQNAVFTSIQYLESSNTNDTNHIRPEKLRSIIINVQRNKIKVSNGIYDCFTNIDLEQFKQKDIPNEIKIELRSDHRFLDVVRAIRLMPRTEQEILLNVSENIGLPTWTQLGKISPEGQTEAGQQAQLAISRNIVELVRELVRLPDAEFQRLYQ